MIYGHGNDLTAYHGKVRIDFSSNVWYGGVPTGLLSYLKAHIDTIADYPEPDALPLKLQIADHFHMKPGQVLVTNGSTEAFYLAAQAWSGCNSIICCPCFSEYEYACRVYHHSINYLEFNDLYAAKSFLDCQLVWLANPNNPDGNVRSLETIERLLKENPQTFFVIDEAYIALCAKAQSAVLLIKSYPNLILVKSLTKIFSVPGLRIGFLLAAEETIARIAANRMPWRVNSLAIEAGKYLWNHYQEFVPSLNAIREESESLQCRIKDIGMFEVYPSACNFFLVKSLRGTATELKSFLIKKMGILIRDASNFRGLDDSFFRIAIQGPDKNRLLIEGIKSWLQSL